MICPKCKHESINFDICPYCKYDLTTVPNPFDVIKINEEYRNIRKKLNLFYYIVILCGTCILIFLIFNLFNKKDSLILDTTNTNEMTTTTTAVKAYVDSTPINPVGLNILTKSSVLYNDKYYDAFVKGIRKINSSEAASLLTSHGLNYDIRYGFNLEGLEYEVTIIDDISDVDPVLNSNYYFTDTGNDYLNINEDIFRINIVNIYDGNKISKNSSARVIVIYQTNESNHSICLGNRSHGAGCIEVINSE